MDATADGHKLFSLHNNGCFNFNRCCAKKYGMHLSVKIGRNDPHAIINIQLMRLTVLYTVNMKLRTLRLCDIAHLWRKIKPQPLMTTQSNPCGCHCTAGAMTSTHSGLKIFMTITFRCHPYSVPHFIRLVRCHSYSVPPFIRPVRHGWGLRGPLL